MHGMESAAAEAMCEALTAAAARGHEATVRRLCECPDLLAATASAPSGCPAIRVACLLSGADRAPEEKAAVRERIVQTLVYGAVPTDAPDADGNRALHIAAGRGLDLLLERDHQCRQCGVLGGRSCEALAVEVKDHQLGLFPVRAEGVLLTVGDIRRGDRR